MQQRMPVLEIQLKTKTSACLVRITKLKKVADKKTRSNGTCYLLALFFAELDDEKVALSSVLFPNDMEVKASVAQPSSSFL